jgi:hypothetical protein
MRIARSHEGAKTEQEERDTNLGEISAVLGRATVLRIGGETDLVVNNHVNSTTARASEEKGS